METSVSCGVMRPVDVETSVSLGVDGNPVMALLGLRWCPVAKAMADAPNLCLSLAGEM